MPKNKSILSNEHDQDQDFCTDIKHCVSGALLNAVKQQSNMNTPLGKTSRNFLFLINQSSSVTACHSPMTQRCVSSGCKSDCCHPRTQQSSVEHLLQSFNLHDQILGSSATVVLSFAYATVMASAVRMQVITKRTEIQNTNFPLFQHPEHLSRMLVV